MPEKTSYSPGEPSWVDLSTPDLDGSIAFYSALFGWTVERGGEDVGGYSIATVNGKQIAGLTPPMQPGQPTVWTSYISTEDADKTAELVQTAGGTVLMPPMDVMDIGRMAVFQGPDGSVLAVWQPKTFAGAELVQEEGVFSWTELSTRDKAAALPYYQSVFGWGVQASKDYTEFQVNGASIAGCMDTPPMVPAEVPSNWLPYFQAENPAAKAEQAAALGATVVVPFMDVEQVAFSVVLDPQGAPFGLLKIKG